jgi:TolB-like protein/DNA-binding winged helix-turn-helix (wHTH) protein
MPADVVKFGDGLELDEGAYELRRSGRALKLERIPMEILLLLVERRGHLVARGDIIARVWGEHVFLDTDSSINGAIRKIRQVLKDDPENPVFVQTVTGKGYRFIAAVTEASVPAGQIGVGQKLASPNTIRQDGTAPFASRPALATFWTWSCWTWSWPSLASLAALLVAVLVGGIYGLRLRARSPSAVIQHRVMLAVLPFANLSNDPEQEYFSDGLTEETITDLGELNPERLGVIARTSATAYKHTNKTIAQIGHELGVDYILEGSVRREGGVARISAQLIRVNDQLHLWAHNYDRQTGGLLALQNELGRAIAQQVKVKLTPLYGVRSGNKYAPNPDAYELYLKGRFYLNQRTYAEIDKSTEYFERSIEKDPGFALGYAGLADSYLANAIRSSQDFYPKAKAAASRALELDDDLPEAHTALGAEKADFEYDWQGAEQELKRALELNPNYAEAHYRYAWSYLTPLIGEFDVPQLYARLGDKQKALEWLARNYEERRPLGTLLNVDPAFDSLRSDPRFGDLVRRMGLTPNAKGQ